MIDNLFGHNGMTQKHLCNSFDKSKHKVVHEGTHTTAREKTKKEGRKQTFYEHNYDSFSQAFFISHAMIIFHN